MRPGGCSHWEGEFGGVIGNLNSMLSVYCQPEHHGAQDDLHVHMCVCVTSSYKDTHAKYVQGYKRVNVWEQVSSDARV